MKLTRAQKAVLKDIEHNRYASLRSGGGVAGHHKRTLDLMVERGLVEWDENKTGWPRVFAIGGNASIAAQTKVITERREWARDQRAEELVLSPVASARAIVALEEKLHLFNPDTYKPPAWLQVD